MSVSPDDERPHAPGAELSWVETTWLELADEASGLAGVVRLDVRPNQGASEAAFTFFLEDGGFVTARHVTPHVAGASSVVEIEDVRLETVEPLRRWSVKYDGPSHALADAADSARREAWQKSRLERLIVELEVTALQEPVPGDGSFAQPVQVRGEVWVSGDRYALDARALRGRSWGGGLVPERSCRVALTFDDGRMVLAQTRTGAGGDQVDGWTSVGGEVRRVQALRVERAVAAPSPAATLFVRDECCEHDIAVTLPHVAPLPGQRAGGKPFELRLGVARARWDGHAGRGLLEEIE